MLSPNRRQFLLDTFALPLISKMWRAQGAPESVHSYREEMPDMLLSYFAQKTNALAAEWEQVRSKIQTAAAMEDRNRFVREKITAMLGGFPPRSPLDPIVAKVMERDGYRIENRVWVTGNLYVPTSGTRPFP